MTWVTTTGIMKTVMKRMARNKLTVSQLKAKTTPGRIGDGDGLYLHVAPAGTKSWVFVYVRAGRRFELGLGSFGSGTSRVTLADARAKADEIRAILGRGGDPRKEIAERRTAAAPKTFGDCADAFLSGKKGTWRNEKHRAQWEMTLGDAYCRRLREKSVAEITTEDVVAVLEPHWRDKHETASRLRGRIERVLDFAKVEGVREGENPARWKGHLEHRLARPERKLVRGHHAALPYPELPAFMGKLRQQKGTGARALEFTILTAARTGETMGSQWGEFDLGAKVWTIPAERMKAGREHRVPLSAPVLHILKEAAKTRRNDFVFPGARDRRPISNMTMAKALAAAGAGDFTVHGFRSSFRDWVHEATTFPGDLAEAALAHVVGDETERAYRRGDALEKRRKLTAAWARYLSAG